MSWEVGLRRLQRPSAHTLKMLRAFGPREPGRPPAAEHPLLPEPKAGDWRASYTLHAASADLFFGIV